MLNKCSSIINISYTPGNLPQKYQTLSDIIPDLCEECLFVIDVMKNTRKKEKFGFYLPFHSGSFGYIKILCAKLLTLLFETEIFMINILEEYFSENKTYNFSKMISSYDFPDINDISESIILKDGEFIISGKSHEILDIISEIGKRYIYLSKGRKKNVDIAFFVLWLAKSASWLSLMSSELDIKYALSRTSY